MSEPLHTARTTDTCVPGCDLTDEVAIRARATALGHEDMADRIVAAHHRQAALAEPKSRVLVGACFHVQRTALFNVADAPLGEWRGVAGRIAWVSAYTCLLAVLPGETVDDAMAAYFGETS